VLNVLSSYSKHFDERTCLINDLENENDAIDGCYFKCKWMEETRNKWFLIGTFV